MNRRELLKAAGTFAVAGATTSQILQPVKAIAADVKRVRIQNIEAFAIQLPRVAGVPSPAVGATGPNADPSRLVCTRVTTEAGVRGYSFLGASTAEVENAKKVMVGEDLFAVEQHLSRGLIKWAPIEESVWDAIGRTAGQPVHRLLGGARTATLPVYVTYVWGDRQTKVTPKQQAEWAVVVKKAGFTAMKVQIWRPNFMEDVEACAEIMAAAGPGFRTMADRTADKLAVWRYQEGLAAAQALQKAGVWWLEEPFDRNDFEGPARLAREVEILITGGEGYPSLSAFRECLMHQTYDILQPDCDNVGGILMLRKVGAMCQAWGIPICPHGTSGLGWAGRLQASAAMGSMTQEIAVLNPPQLPDDRVTPAMSILNSVPFVYRDGEVVVPQGPGLGLDLNEEAINRFRVDGPIHARGVYPENISR